MLLPSRSSRRSSRQRLVLINRMSRIGSTTSKESDNLMASWGTNQSKAISVFQASHTLPTRSGQGFRVNLPGFHPEDTREKHFGLDVDIGTTTVVAELVDMNTCHSLGTRASHNLQIGYGEDVISRIVFACNRGGEQTLQESVVETVNKLVHAVCTEAGIDRREITAMVCAGNTTMTHLLLGLPLCNIRLEPYIPVVNQYPTVAAKEIGIAIHPNGIVFCIPGVSSYVGGDITSGVVYTELAESDELTLFMDLDTNGEMVLGNRDWLTCCSASVGPAFEGGGIHWGMRATAGAIEKVIFNEADNDLRYETIGGKSPKGICGSGLIDILGTFLLHGVIDQQGRFFPDKAGKRLKEREGSKEYIIAFEDETDLEEDITITEEDIQNVIRSKAAVYAAATTMIHAMGLTLQEDSVPTWTLRRLC